MLKHNLGEENKILPTLQYTNKKRNNSMENGENDYSKFCCNPKHLQTFQALISPPNHIAVTYRVGQDNYVKLVKIGVSWIKNLKRCDNKNCFTLVTLDSYEQHCCGDYVSWCCL